MQLSYPLHTEQAISKCEAQASHKLEHNAKNVSRRNPFGLEEKSAKSYRGETAMIADHISVSTSQWSEDLSQLATEAS